MHSEPQRMDAPLEPPIAAQPRRATARLAIFLGSALLVIAGLVSGYVVLRNLANNGFTEECPEPDNITLVGGGLGKKPFEGWGKPELVVVITGQMHGYIFPCGCSEPQYGGLIRRQTLIDELKAKGWEVVGIDIGEIVPTSGIPEQKALKVKYTMEALEVMGYKAIGMGKSEMAFGLIDLLSLHTINPGKEDKPRPIASTLDLNQKDTQYHRFGVRPSEIVGGKGKASPHIGVLSLTGPDLELSFANDKALKFLNNQNAVLPKLQAEFAAAKPKIDFAVMLYHEYPDGVANPIVADKARRAKADMTAKAWEASRKNNKDIPPLGIIAIVTDEPEPPFGMTPVEGTKTHILEIGHKGKYAGVIGVSRKGKQLDMKYEVVLIEPKFQPDKGQKNKVLDLLDAYAKEVKTEGLLEKYIRTPHPTQVEKHIQDKFGGAHFVGSDECGKCHKQAFNVWKASDHAKAFATLVQANKPALRQYDPECVICHTVGFKHNEGWNDLPRADRKALGGNKTAMEAAIRKRNPSLEQVGCESCHGPGSAHVEVKWALRNNPNAEDDPKVDELINPFRPTAAEANAKGAAAKGLFDRRMDAINTFCTKCHDEQNDVNWHKLLGRDDDFDKWVGKGLIHNSKANPGNRFLPAPAIRADNGKKE